MMMMDAGRPAAISDTADLDLIALLGDLKADGYRFVTPTPASHARVLDRPDRQLGRTLRDLLGWSLPVLRSDINPAILAALEAIDMIETQGELVRSRLRVSSLDHDLYCHSAYPTTAEDAVFFGPDSYRFAALIKAELDHSMVGPEGQIVDIGTGAGVGAVVAAHLCPEAGVIMTDINAEAVRYAAVNAAAAGVQADALLAADLDAVDGPIDVILANPPYIIDPAGRDYRDGGGMHGAEVAFDMARMAVPRIAPGGRLILYTGSAIIAGTDPLGEALSTLADETQCHLRYREIDPDVFGDELANPAYGDVDRIAVVAAVIERSGGGHDRRFPVPRRGPRTAG